jgi:hypothetical protein
VPTGSRFAFWFSLGGADLAMDWHLWWKIVAYANTADTIDLKNIRIIKKQGGTVEYSEMVDGLVLNQTQD